MMGRPLTFLALYGLMSVFMCAGARAADEQTPKTGAASPAESGRVAGSQTTINKEKEGPGHDSNKPSAPSGFVSNPQTEYRVTLTLQTASDRRLAIHLGLKNATIGESEYLVSDDVLGRLSTAGLVPVIIGGTSRIRLRVAPEQPQASSATPDVQGPAAVSNGSSTLYSGNVNMAIPDTNAGYYLVMTLSSAPADATVTSLGYQVRLIDNGDGDFYCGDYELWLFSGGVAQERLIYDNLGGRTDGGFDDDTDDDNDIWLNWRSTSYFNGETANQPWGILIYDRYAADEGLLQYLNLEIGWEVASSGDSFEPDDSASQATAQSVNSTSAPHSIDPIGDEDWVYFDLGSAAEVTIETLSAISGDTRLWLYDGSLGQIGYNDDGGDGLFSRIFQPLSPGRYYLRVDEYGGNDTIANYAVAISADALPDLTAPTFNWTGSTVAEGDLFSITQNITNAGGVDAGSTHARLFLSTDNDFDWSDDYEISPEQAVTALAPSEVASTTWDFAFPDLSSGSSYDVWIVCVVDSRDEVLEEDEANTYKSNSALTVTGATVEPDIFIDPTTLSFSEDVVSTSAPLAPEATQSEVIDLDDATEDLGVYLIDQVVVRFQPRVAGKLHSHRLDRQLPSSTLSRPVPGTLAAPLPADVSGIRPFRSGQVKAERVVREHPGIARALQAGRALRSAQRTTLEEALVDSQSSVGPMGLFYLRLSNGVDVLDLCKRLMNRPDVVYAHPVPIDEIAAAPNDPLYSRMWNLDRIGMPAAWDLTTNAVGSVRVCVVDTGVRVDHTELAGRIADPTDVYLSNGDAYSDSDPSNDDPYGHGTACAGIIASARDNASLVAGIAPVTIIPVNGAVYSGGSWGIANYTEGVYWGIDHGAFVVSLSLGSTRSGAYQAEIDAAAYAEQNNVLVFAAAGNDDADADQHYPSAISYYVSVAAVDDDDLRVAQPKWWWGSNFGDTVEISAPGQGNVGSYGDSVLTLGNSGDTAYINYFNGTSAATPHVAGVAALIKHANPVLSASDIRAILETTAEDQIGDPSEDVAGWDPYHGHGLVNADAALTVALGSGFRTFTIRNNGNDTLSITDIQLDASADWIEWSPTGPFDLAPGEQRSVRVSVDYDAAPSGSSSRRLLVYSNDPDESPYPTGVYVDVDAQQADDAYEENDTRASAFSLEGRERTWLSSIGGQGVQADDDWYRLDVSPGYNQVNVDCRFQHTEGDIDIAVYTDAGNIVAYSASVSDNEYLEAVLPEGDTVCFIRVYYANAGNVYDLWWDDIQSSVNVPDVVGLELSTAQAEFQAANLFAGTIDYEHSDSVPADVVMSQLPVAGTSVPTGSSVDLVVSRGSDVTVPDVVGIERIEAEVAIAAAGLAVGSVDYDYSSVFTTGSVMGQSPASGLVVPSGTAVDLVISEGKAPSVVPNVTGLIEPEAREAIANAGYVVGPVSYALDTTVTTGTVLRQSPEPGTAAGRGSSVALVVANDPAKGLDAVWVDFSFTGQESGTYDAPFASVADAMEVLASGGILKIKSSQSTEAVRATKPSRWVAPEGPALIGVP